MVGSLLCLIGFYVVYNGITYNLNSVVKNLPKYRTNHCPLVFKTSMATLHVNSIFRFDSAGLKNEELNELVLKW
jgi:hypothetical protein